MNSVPAAVLACAGLAACVAPQAALAQGPLTDSFPAEFDLATLDGTQGTRFRGEGSGDGVGWAISRAGDVNNDGIDDFVVGGPEYGTATTAEVGRVYVIFGRDPSLGDPFPANLRMGLLDGTNGFALQGEDPADWRGWAGFAVGAAGDVNGDGIDDVVVAAPYARSEGDDRSGRVYVVFGRDTAAGDAFPPEIALSDLNGSDGFKVAGDRSEELGFSVAGVGDVDGDGFDDVLLGTPDNPSHAAVMVWGRDTFPAVIKLTPSVFEIADSEFSSLGESVVGGDFNNDGFRDVVLMSRGGGGVVLLGDGTRRLPSELSDLTGENGFRIRVPTGKTFSDVDSAGDVNGDGIEDLIIGHYHSSTTSDLSGAHVVFGRDTAIAGPFASALQLADLDGSDGFFIEATGDEFRLGGRVAALGDVNSDGFDDVSVSSGRADGRAYVVYGWDGATTPFPAVFSLTTLDGTNGFSMFDATMGRLGSDVAGGLDFNADGVSDLLITDVSARRGTRSGAGVAIVVFGRQPAPPCRADMDGDGSLTLFDFLAFQSAFDLGDLAADFDDDGVLTFFDFLAFQTAFAIGCP